jgi:uncharacterized protein (TIGR03067 family)
VRTFALTVLLVAAGLSRADDVDPEPPGGNALRKLQGKWESVRRIVMGQEAAYTQASYHFEKDKVTYARGKGKGRPRTMTLKPDAKRPDYFALTEENSRFDSGRYYFKVEKGELYLLPAIWGKPKGKEKPDFSGKEAPVTIFKKVK